jgi:hypothetical protein
MSVSQTIQIKMIGYQRTDELEGIWEEAVLAW